MVDSKDLPKRPRAFVRIPDTSDVTIVMTCLRSQSPELNAADCSVMSLRSLRRRRYWPSLLTPTLLNP